MNLLTIDGRTDGSSLQSEEKILLLTLPRLVIKYSRNVATKVTDTLMPASPPPPTRTLMKHSDMTTCLDPETKLGVEKDTVALLEDDMLVSNVQRELKHYTLVEIVVTFQDWWRHGHSFKFNLAYISEKIVTLYTSPVAGVTASVHSQGELPLSLEEIESIKNGQSSPPKPAAVVVTIERHDDRA